MGFGRVNAYDALSYNLSIDDTILEDLVFYPNPASNKIFISKDSSIDYIIYNAAGKQIKFGNTSREIDISSLNNGVYFLNYQFENKSSVIKIIKN